MKKAKVKHKDTNINIKVMSSQKVHFKKLAEERGVTLTNLILIELNKLK